MDESATLLGGDFLPFSRSFVLIEWQEDTQHSWQLKSGQESKT